MKKLILAICLAFLSVGAYATNDLKITDVSVINKETELTKVKKKGKVENKYVAEYTYTSSCGVVWDVTASEGLSMNCHAALWQLMEDACGTTTEEVEVIEGIDC